MFTRGEGAEVSSQRSHVSCINVDEHFSPWKIFTLFKVLWGRPFRAFFFLLRQTSDENFLALLKIEKIMSICFLTPLASSSFLPLPFLPILVVQGTLPENHQHFLIKTDSPIDEHSSWTSEEAVSLLSLPCASRTLLHSQMCWHSLAHIWLVPLMPYWHNPPMCVGTDHQSSLHLELLEGR